jgi:hypothetical protein
MTSFLSIVSDNGVPIETIADLVWAPGTTVTKKVHRRQLRPVISSLRVPRRRTPSSDTKLSQA